MVIPVLVPIVPLVAVFVAGNVSLGAIAVVLHRKLMKLLTLSEFSYQLRFSSFTKEIEIFENKPYGLSKNSRDFDKVYFEFERKSIIRSGFFRSTFTSKDEEYNMVKFDTFDDFDSEPSFKGPPFKEFWLGKSEDDRIAELVKKENAYEGRQFIKIETFLYIVGLESRIKYQEKSFWLSESGINIAAKDTNDQEMSEEKFYIAEITLGEFKISDSGKLCAVDKGVIRMKMTREGLDIHDHSCSTGSTSINAKTSLEEALENEAQRIANKRAKSFAGRSKPSTNMEGMELRRRGAQNLS